MKKKAKGALIGTLDWRKGGGLVPAVVQDARDGTVLMVGWMNRAALAATIESGLVTFFSRSRRTLWTKGESSGRVLRLRSIRKDCDSDTLLVAAAPTGPVCHRGTATCFDAARAKERAGGTGFLDILDALVAERVRRKPRGSYVAGLLASGADRVAQKVGEEAVETVIAAKNASPARLDEEAADLLFHLIVLLRSRGSSLSRVAETLRRRHANR
ncbi:MAG: bifunctional phosphoribosyl-AMP cyclohydrolase/phosphoribosyl-ATP diphosphatase HisIE [Proteobacteria bacterium]|nr:bifunctional phosphoribosyl-AMP cyclohydrolase/phosphoribosyl-ATP diphosphatase HisIE [Pseudomonadota bacterium]